MSNLRVAIISEGPTDLVILEAALTAILAPRTFIPTLIQPDLATQPQLGAGWCGVLKWCDQFRARNSPSLEDDATLEQYDLFVVHIDADVADKSYSNCGQRSAGGNLASLPCSDPCPPPEATTVKLRKVLLSWLGMATCGQRTVLCIPSKASEAWLVAGLYPDDPPANIECIPDWDGWLGQLKKAVRFRKSKRDYQERADSMIAKWESVKSLCSQAKTFDDEVTAVAATLP